METIAPQSVRWYMSNRYMSNQSKHLARRANEPSGSNVIERYSAKASAVMAARMLDFTREMLLVKEDLWQRQADNWLFELRLYPAHLIEKAFHTWVRQSKFMPVPAEIIGILEKLVEADQLERRLREDAAKLEECREIREQLQAGGEPCGLEQVRKLLGEALDRIKKQAPLPDPNQIPLLKERLARAMAARDRKQAAA